MFNAYSEMGLRIINSTRQTKIYYKKDVIQTFVNCGFTEEEAKKVWVERYGDAEEAKDFE